LVNFFESKIENEFFIFLIYDYFTGVFFLPGKNKQS
jgi:hypothetical protein